VVGREHSHPPSVDPDVADGETTPIARAPAHPELDGRARTAGQTWIGWRVQLLPGEVAAGGDPGVRARTHAEDRAERDAARRRLREVHR
jgi:hypothetical protein